MHAFLTIPFSKVPMNLQKINSNIYYHPESEKFYKTTMLEPITAFIKEDLATRQNIVMTQYDSSFLVLEHYNNNALISINQIPKYLTRAHFQSFGDLNEDGKFIKKNDQKILDFLEKRALDVLQMIEEKNYYKQDVIRLSVKDQSSNAKRQIPNVVIDFLRQDVPEQLIEALMITRLKRQAVKRPIMVDNYRQEDQNYKQKQKKQSKKPKAEKKIINTPPPNQPSLFQFMGKK